MRYGRNSKGKESIVCSLGRKLFSHNAKDQAKAQVALVAENEIELNTFVRPYFFSTTLLPFYFLMQ